MEARLEASSPELARRLNAPRPSTRRVAPSPLASDRGRVALVLVSLSVSLALATVITSIGLAVWVEVGLLVAELVALLAVAHVAARHLHGPLRPHRGRDV